MMARGDGAALVLAMLTVAVVLLITWHNSKGSSPAPADEQLTVLVLPTTTHCIRQTNMVTCPPGALSVNSPASNPAGQISSVEGGPSGPGGPAGPGSPGTPGTPGSP
jgi:hypothetical protein